MKSSETTEVRRSKNCVDWSVLKNFHVISIMLLAVGYKFTTSNYYAYCGALVQQIGHTAHEASYLLSLSGMADIFGNIIYGVLFDLPFVKKRNMTCYCIAHLLFGTTVVIIPLLKEFLSLCVAFGMWGLVTACFGTKDVILSDHVNSLQFPDAVGISLVAVALGFGMGAPVTGKRNCFQPFS